MKTEELLAAECRLKQIEQDPKSFTLGRRNDDVVNWFLAKKLVEIHTPGGPDRRKVMEYIAEFEMIEKSGLQKDSLREWNYDGMNAERKIRQLYQHYGHLTHAGELESYLISVSYRPIKIPA
jgi:hypothetical protein